ncbi:multidrug RND transporter [Thermocladium modestius]|uniref:Multidrug RND transporter n=1 Tax=Thermocladium modestius TaxID=62609 RepID=A0A830GVV7_9CREN|nr:MMPL family transporter [Thermocladium modestius]GGP19320.1 multidrug RND transporter [Thermocladium modestius]
MMVLAALAPRVFNSLIYNDSQLLPSNIPPTIVERYVGSAANQSYTAIIVNSSGNVMDELAALDGMIMDPHVDQLTIYEKYVVSRYNETVDEYIRMAEANATEELLSAWNAMNSTCMELSKLNAEYYGQLSLLRSTQSALSRYVQSYNSILIQQLQKANPNGNSSLIAITALNLLNEPTNYSSYMEEYAVQVAKALNGSAVDELTPSKLENALIHGYHAVEASLRSKYPLPFTKPNSTLALAIALGPSRSGINAAVAGLYINDSPPLIKPFLPQIACSSNITGIESQLNNSIRKLIIQENPLPSPTSLNYGLINGSYALILVNSSSTRLYSLHNDSIFVFNPSLINLQLINMVENDVPTIDKVTGTAVLSMLFFVLGTVMGPLLVLAMLGTADAASLGSIYLLSKAGLPVYYLTVYLTSPIILGIGIDYSLLILGRYLEERRRGLNREEALGVVRRVTIPTILSSGGVVAAGLGSYVFSTYQYIQVIGISYIISVALVLFTVVLVLPDVISLLGDRVLWPMGLKANTRELSTKLLVRLSRKSVDRPKTVIAIFTVITLASLLLIAKTINISSNPVNMMPPSNPVTGLRLLETRFPNYLQSTAYVLIKPGNEAAYSAFIAELSTMKGIGNVTLLDHNSSIILAKIPIDHSVFSDKLIGVYEELSGAAGNVSRQYGVTVLIGGDPGYKFFSVQAFEDQFYHTISLVVIALVMLMLFIMLRSALIPVRLVITVLMSMSWSIALTIIVFQLILRIPTYYLLPIILYSLLMSVGTDYDIFIVSRVREEVMRGLSDKDAIVKAIDSTGPIVSGAAMVLAAAFAGLTVSRLFILKEIGFAVAVAVAMDALILRPVLVPAILVVLGKWNWWPLKVERKIERAAN